MKLLCSADWHIHNKSPSRFLINRLDFQLNILEQLLIMSLDYDYLIMAGDMFENFNESATIVNQVIELFEKYNVKSKLKIVYGNHDLEFNTMKNYKTSSLYTVLNHFKIDVSSDETFYLEHFKFKDEEPVEKYNNQPIVVIHAYHDNSDKLKYVSNGFSSLELAKLYPSAKLVVSGDNHKRFKHKIKSINFINCGSLIPYNVDDSLPEVFSYDTKTEKIEKHKLKYPAKLFNTKLDITSLNNESIFSISDSETTELDDEYNQSWKDYIRKHIVEKYDNSDEILEKINL